MLKMPKILTQCWVREPLLHCSKGACVGEWVKPMWREGWRYQIGWILKVPKEGRGLFPNQKFMLQILGALIHPIWYRHPSLRIELGIFGDIWHSFHRSVPYFIAQNEKEGGKGFLNNVQKQHCNIDSQGLPLLALWQKVQKVSATHQ